jgi:small subunit ribosomal protein S15e
MTTAVAALRKKRQFRKFTFRGLELEKILDLNQEELLEVVHARARRRMLRGMKKKRHVGLLNKLKKAKKAAGALDKPAPVKTHLRNMVIVPDMIGSQVAIYNGKVFNLVLITADMLGSYLGEYSITYRPVRHGRPGLGSTNSSRFIPLK